jgi:hypothetical protein
MSVDGDILEKLAAALQAVKLDAVVVGNAAGELHGAPISTEDVDLLIRDTATNRRKLKALVEKLGGVGMVDIHDLITAKRIHLPDFYVDILFDKLTGRLTFNALRSRSTLIAIGDHELRVAALEDVIRAKEAAGRAKDRAALPILRDTLAVKNVREKHPPPKLGRHRSR